MSDASPVEAQPSVPALLVHRVSLAAELRRAWLDELSAREERPWLHDTRPAQRAFIEGAAELRATREALATVDQRLLVSANVFSALVRALELDTASRDLFALAAARALEPRVGDVLRGLDPTSGGDATSTLAAGLFGHALAPSWARGSLLHTWGLVSAMEMSSPESTPLACDASLLPYLAGSGTVLDGLGGVCKQTFAAPPLSSWPVAAVKEAIDRIDAAKLHVIVRGAAGAGRRTFAATMTGHYQMLALDVDTEAVSDADWPCLYRRVERATRLYRMAPVWRGRHAIARRPPLPAAAALEWSIVDADAELGRTESLVVDVGEPTRADRSALWSHHLDAVDEWSAEELRELVDGHGLLPGDIAAVGAAAPDDAEQAARLCRDRTRLALRDVGQLVGTPFDMDDLVVADELRSGLEELVFEARDRRVFWEQDGACRLFPRGRGVTALFAGLPGTGKTMAAQVIAGELGLDLVRVDLATTVSKYIGETAKNLRRVFQRAAPLDVVLLFDEADALFAKRTDVKDSHDRYANADTNYLLQLLEDFPGVALLATNKRSNIDGAFVRRLRYVFELPRPDEALRLRILRRVAIELFGGTETEALDPALRTLAAVDLSGAQLKNSLLAAAFLARQHGGGIALPHLLRGAERELYKEGRSLGVRERRRLGGRY